MLAGSKAELSNPLFLVQIDSKPKRWGEENSETILIFQIAKRQSEDPPKFFGNFQYHTITIGWKWETFVSLKFGNGWHKNIKQRKKFFLNKKREKHMLVLALKSIETDSSMLKNIDHSIKNKTDNYYYIFLYNPGVRISLYASRLISGPTEHPASPINR